MSTEYNYLALTAWFTSMMWMPYILNSMLVRGVMATFRNPDPDAPPLAPWAERAKRAHTNAVENLVIFASLVLLIGVSGRSTEFVGHVAAVYFGARIVHFVVYTAGIPVVRTLAFLVGFACQIALVRAALGG